jgi:hypothetical protein
MIKFIKLFLVFAIVASYYFLPAVINAAGILSEPINIDNARRGQTHWEDLIFINSAPQEINFELFAEGDIARWISFYSKDNDQNPITKLMVPGQSEIGARAKFTIPDNLANGKYKGLIVGRILISSGKISGQTTAQIMQRLDREVNITVTDNQILDFNTIFIPASYTMVKDVPLKVRVIHENHGNIDIKPNIELRINKDGKEIFKAVFPYPDNTAAVQPNERKEISDQVEWRTIGYEAGKYDVVLTTFENGKLNQKEEFSINTGVANKNLSFLSAALNYASGNQNIIGLIAILIAIILALLLKFKNKLFFKKSSEEGIKK